MPTSQAPEHDASDRYFILIDISGYTKFLAGVEEQHGEDFRAGLPAGYRVLGELLQRVVDDLPPDFDLVKVEGDAVFGAAPAERLDGHGTDVVEHLGSMYRTFATRRDALALTATDDKCSACFAISTLDLKAVIHCGFAVRQPIGGASDYVGPAVNVAHRLLKNTVRTRVGARPYLLVSRPAASRLGLDHLGIDHQETYPDVGQIDVRILDLADAAGIAVAAPIAAPGPDWPEITIARS